LRTRKVKVGDRIVELPAREFTPAETFLRHQTQNLPMFETYQKCDIAVLKKVRYALCPMPYALCPMPYAHEYLIFLRKAICF
jgi:hypothetical protein